MGFACGTLGGMFELKPANQKRTEQFRIRLSEKEKAKIQKKAARAKVEPSVWARAVLLAAAEA